MDRLRPFQIVIAVLKKADQSLSEKVKMPDRQFVISHQWRRTFY
jgi:hypothetical protein